MSAEFITGFTAMGCLVAALWFARFWRDSGDRFFAYFAVAFAVLGLNRVILGFLSESSEARPAAYSFRLLAYGLILVAIVEKNRVRR